MARPCKIDTIQFRRKLSDAERTVLLAAGAGCLTEGFHHILTIYAHVHGLGFRPGMDPERLTVSNYQDQTMDS